jgi:hypothetical protein
LATAVNREGSKSFEHHVAGHLGAFTPEQGEEPDPPGHDHVEGERRLQALEPLQLQLLVGGSRS